MSVGCALAVGTGGDVLAGLRVPVAVGSKAKDADGSISAVATGATEDDDTPQATDPIEISKAARVVLRVTLETGRNRQAIKSTSTAREENCPCLPRCDAGTAGLQARDFVLTQYTITNAPGETAEFAKGWGDVG